MSQLHKQWWQKVGACLSITVTVIAPDILPGCDEKEHKCIIEIQNWARTSR